MSPTPALKVDQTPRHKQHHKQLKHERQMWARRRMEGFTRSHTQVEIDDGAIADKTGRHFFELKSFDSTLHWSLDKVQVIGAFHAANRTHIEYRLNPMGKEQRYIVQPRHLRVFEVIRGIGKWEITPKKEQASEDL